MAAPISPSPNSRFVSIRNSMALDHNRRKSMNRNQLIEYIPRTLVIAGLCTKKNCYFLKKMLLSAEYDVYYIRVLCNSKYSCK
jgi:hypothetical protein